MLCVVSLFHVGRIRLFVCVCACVRVCVCVRTCVRVGNIALGREAHGGTCMQPMTADARRHHTKVKKSFVGKFNKVKDEHKKKMHDERKKNASRNSLHGKKNKLADELTSSGHKVR